MNDLPYRPNVCMLVLNAENRLFLGERFRSQGVWQFPQGGVEPKSELSENVLRELHEELGVAEEYFSIIKRLNATHHYDFSPPPSYAVGKWRGQAQTFWLVRFLGVDSLIRLDSHEQEFSAWRWCTPNEVRSLAEPKRLPGYEAPLKEVEAFLKQ